VLCFMRGSLQVRCFPDPQIAPLKRFFFFILVIFWVGSDVFVDDFEDVTIPASSGEPQIESSYTDGSGALFSMYLDRAEEEDIKAAERWKGDADGILVFVRCCRLHTMTQKIR
jgi:hypothetical protein